MAGGLADIGGFRGVIGLSVGMENVVEPDGRLTGVMLLPGFPGIDRLRFSRDKSPVVGSHLLRLHVSQVGIEMAARGASHVFGAEHRAIVSAKMLHRLLERVERRV